MLSNLAPLCSTSAICSTSVKKNLTTTLVLSISWKWGRGGGPEISKMLIRPKFCSKRYPDCDFFYTDNSLLSCEVYVE